MPVISPGDFEPPPPSSCAGCGGQIADRYYLQAVDRQWHVSCLTCCRCKVQLDSELTCFARDGHIYCKEDYFRLFAVKRCARCQHGIYANELVMRARDLVFHLHCFTCHWCNAALTQGDYFGLRDGLVYCRTHYGMLAAEPGRCFPLEEDHGLPDHQISLHGMPGSGMDDAERSTVGDGGGFAAFAVGSAGGGRKGRPRKRKNGDLADAIARQGAGLSPVDPSSCHPQLYHQQLEGGNPRQSSPPLTNGQGQRTKRMRTSFKHHQLRTMKSYFAINQNPDAKDLKQLAQKTGLSKRVLQVWFQNARAKWRRNNLKQQDGSISAMMSGGSGGDQPSTPQMHRGGSAAGMCSPGATSSFSEPSPVHSCGGGVASDGSMSTTQVGPHSMDFDSSSPMTPLIGPGGHHGLSAPGHDGSVMHITSFHELF